MEDSAASTASTGDERPSQLLPDSDQFAEIGTTVPPALNSGADAAAGASGEAAVVPSETPTDNGSAVHEADMVGRSKTRGTTSPVKAVRYEDAADGAPPTLIATAKNPGLLSPSDADDSVHEARDSLEPIANASSTGSLRSSSSKIANLREAFERSGNGDNASRRRFSSTERLSGRISQQSAESAESEKEIAKLKDELERERDTRQAYQEKCQALEARSRKRESALLQSNGMLKEEDEEELSPDNPYVIKRRSEEVSTLQRQLADLKRSISTSTRMDSQVTDSVFAQEMGVLHHELQNWCVASFRRARTDVTPEEMCTRLAGLTGEPSLRHLRPMYEGFTLSAKVAIYQATAVCLLMDIFNNSSLFGLPEDLPWRQPLREAVSAMERVLEPVSHNKWRSVTLDVIRQNAWMQDYVDESATAMAERICSALTALTDVERSEGRFVALRGIVKRAIDLQHLFRVQRAQYQFDLPSPSDDFHYEVMENMAVDESSPVDLIPSVRCATLPSVIKIGDEFGDNVELTNVIFKARVLCSS